MHIVPRYALWLLLPAALCAQGPATGADQESAIIKLVQQYVDARDLRDPKAIEALFIPDADQLVSSGEWRRGRKAVVEGALASSKREAGSRRTIRLETIRFLTPEVAIADGPYELAGLPGGQDRKMWTTFVLKRIQGNWRIAAIRNMLPAPPASSR
jgi:uncharacterized protein (TIGR02246 family)